MYIAREGRFSLEMRASRPRNLASHRRIMLLLASKPWPFRVERVS